MNYNPLVALGIFGLLALLAYLVFRPVRGWFFRYRNRWKNNEKVQSEDLLKQLYHLEKQLSNICVSDLSRTLNFSENKTAKLLNALYSSGLVTLDKENIRLTNEGKDYALRIVRVHRLWEKYLAEKTGYDKKEWHDRAEKMEHLLDKEATRKLASDLKNPVFDPHGDPIPSESGELALLKGVPLDELPEGSAGKIIHLEDEPERVYHQILKSKIHIGSYIEIRKKTKTAITYFSEGETFSVPKEVAHNITVSALNSIPEREKNYIRLTKLKKNEKAEVVGISEELRGENRRRLLDLGFVKGSPIEIDLESPLGNTRAYLIKGTTIALREDQASKILVKKRNR